MAQCMCPNPFCPTHARDSRGRTRDSGVEVSAQIHCICWYTLTTTGYTLNIDKGCRVHNRSVTMNDDPAPPLENDRTAMMLGLVPDKRTPEQRLEDAVATNGESLKYKYGPCPNCPDDECIGCSEWEQ